MHKYRSDKYTDKLSTYLSESIHQKRGRKYTNNIDNKYWTGLVHDTW